MHLKLIVIKDKEPLYMLIIVIFPSFFAHYSFHTSINDLKHTLCIKIVRLPCYCLGEFCYRVTVMYALFG
jgi:hypothetical protein